MPTVAFDMPDGGGVQQAGHLRNVPGQKDVSHGLTSLQIFYGDMRQATLKALGIG